MIARPIGVLLVALCATGGADCAETGLTAAAPAAALPAPDADGFIALFNGRDLAGWTGLGEHWSVENGEISGHQIKETSRQTFLIRSGMIVRDFELHFRYRFATPEGNSGLQFRSRVLDAQTSRVGGYQADFDAERRYDGTIYDEAGVAGGRETMSNRGEKTTWDAENRRRAEPLDQSGTDLQALIGTRDWNDATLVARGNHIVYSINGRVMTDLVDASPAALQSGYLALQLHEGFTMDVRFKDLRIKLLNR